MLEILHLLFNIWQLTRISGSYHSICVLFLVTRFISLFIEDKLHLFLWKKNGLLLQQCNIVKLDVDVD